MKTLSLELIGFKRTRLNISKRIKLTFSEIIQIILGSNGSGKSSLMRESFPLPGHKNAFEKWGKKIWVGEDDNGIRYTLTSIFEPHTRHQFIRHDEEGDVILNDWGTTDAQNKLVEDVFRITEAIRNLMLGRERFTRMGTGKRREWILRLNNANYEYALAVYKKVNDEANEATAALRNTRKRLVVEQEKVLNDEELNKLNNEVNQMERELNVLMEMRAPVERPAVSFEDEQKQQLAELESMTKRLYRLRFIAPYGYYHHSQLERDEWRELVRPSFTSLEEINHEIQRLKGEVMSRDALINKAVKEHDRLNEQLQVLTKTGEAGITALQARFKAIQARKVEVLATRTLVDVLEGLDNIQPINGMGALESVWDTLDDICATIPDNSERDYSQAKLAALTTLSVDKITERLKIKHNLDKLIAKKEHAEAHRGKGETICPNCSYRWVLGYNESEYERLLNGIEVYSAQVKQLEADSADIQEQIGRINDYGGKYRTFIRLTQAWPVLDPLWDHLIANEYIVTKARLTMGFVDRFRHDLQIMKDAMRLDAELEEVSLLIASAEKLGDASLIDVRTGVEQWAHEIEHLTGERNLLQKDVVDYQAYYRQMAEGVELGARIEKMRSDVVHTNQEWIETIRRETILHCIKQLRTSLARKEETLSYINSQKARVMDMESQIEELAVREHAARLVRDQLSPSEGLISEGLLGFIRYFVGQMNHVIGRIWSYPLVVQDCAVESHGGTELDYRFPVLVNDQDEPIEDVSDGSTGIQEIIDLAFRISAMHSLGLANSPLFLDEFGASFDKHHQSMATITIANIMEERQFPQLFMVSHYEASYGALANAEICVLCPSNITVPVTSQYNLHVEME